MVKASNEVISEELLPAYYDASVELLYNEGARKVRRTLPVLPSEHFDSLMVVLFSARAITYKIALISNSKQRMAGRVKQFGKSVLSSLGALVQTDKLILDTRSLNPNNIAHLIVDIIPVCLYVRSKTNEDITFLFREMGPHCLALLRFFDIEPTVTAKSFYGREVVLRGTRGLSVYDLLTIRDRPRYTFFNHIYDDIPFGEASEYSHVFLARRGERSLINHQQVEQMLSGLGYKTLYMEDYPISEQLRICTNANYVVAMHGAAMALLAANKVLKSVVEIFPPNVHHLYYATSFAGNGIQAYYQLLPDFSWSVANSGWAEVLKYKSANFSVDLEQLTSVLEEIHA